jgi:hypothetical protein
MIVKVIFNLSIGGRLLVVNSEKLFGNWVSLLKAAGVWFPRDNSLRR